MPSSNENAADKSIETELREPIGARPGEALDADPRGPIERGRHQRIDAGEPLDTDEEATEQTLLEQLGGFSGLIYSTLPVLVFVPVNTFAGLTAAIWAALGVAAAILIWRLARRSPIQPAISGFIGVGICAFIAYRMGEAKGFFLFGIYTSLVYAGVFLVSMLVRRPLVGVIWGVLNGHGSDWRTDRRVVRPRHHHLGAGLRRPLPGAVAALRHQPHRLAGHRAHRDGLAADRGRAGCHGVGGTARGAYAGPRRGR
jgi:hypothetical protein